MLVVCDVCLAGVGAVRVRAPPPCCGVLCLCVAPPMVGRAVLVSALPMMGRAVLVCGPPHGGACSVGAWPPSWWGMLCWCLPAAVVVVGLGCRRLLGGLGLRLCCLLGLGWCCASAPPPLFGHAVFVRAPPLGGACGVGMFGFRFMVL